LKTPVGRVEFARQIYNLLHTPTEEAVEDTAIKVGQLQEKVLNHKRTFGMKSFYTKGAGQDTSRKRPRTGNGAGADGGAGAVAGGAYCAELSTRGYEVQPEAIVNASGITFESLVKVRLLTIFYL